jgi:uncharacterized protein
LAVTIFVATNSVLKIEFDPEKSARNARERELPFELTAEIDWDSAHIAEDTRRDYGETRFLAYAPIRGRLHVICFCIRGAAFRIISFRKANDREETFYAKEEAARDR